MSPARFLTLPLALFLGALALVGAFLVGMKLPASAQGASPSPSPENFVSLLARAKSGDVIRLPEGRYGDLVIRGRSFPTALRILAEDAARPPVFNSVQIRDSQGIALVGVTVEYSPTSATLENTPVMNLEGSGRITFSGGRISSRPAINGVPETATTLDKTGNVIGWPTGRIIVMRSTDVTIEHSDIYDLGRGIALGDSKGVTIRGNKIHGLRRTSILGGSSDLLIEENHLYDIRPWRLGETPVGDHADFIALWTPSTGEPFHNVRILRNVMERGGGTPIMGVWLGGPLGYENVEIRGNEISGTDHQGIMTTNTRGVIIADNVLHGRAGIILREGTVNALVTGNAATVISDKNKGSTGNRIERNRKSVAAPEVSAPGTSRR